MSTTRFVIGIHLRALEEAALFMAATTKKGTPHSLDFSINTADRYLMNMVVFVKKASYENSNGKTMGFEGVTAAGRHVRGLYVPDVSKEKLKIRGYGFIDVEVPDTLGWDKDGSKVFLL